MKLNEQIDLFGETEAAQPKNNLADESCAESLSKVGQSGNDPSLDRAELAAATALASAILNFDDAVSKR